MKDVELGSMKICYLINGMERKVNVTRKRIINKF